MSSFAVKLFISCACRTKWFWFRVAGSSGLRAQGSCTHYNTHTHLPTRPSTLTGITAFNRFGGVPSEAFSLYHRCAECVSQLPGTTHSPKMSNKCWHELKEQWIRFKLPLSNKMAISVMCFEILDHYQVLQYLTFSAHVLVCSPFWNQLLPPAGVFSDGKDCFCFLLLNLELLISALNS